MGLLLGCGAEEECYIDGSDHVCESIVGTQTTALKITRWHTVGGVWYWYSTCVDGCCTTADGKGSGDPGGSQEGCL